MTFQKILPENTWNKRGTHGCTDRRTTSLYIWGWRALACSQHSRGWRCTGPPVSAPPEPAPGPTPASSCWRPGAELSHLEQHQRDTFNKNCVMELILLRHLPIVKIKNLLSLIWRQSSCWEWDTWWTYSRILTQSVLRRELTIILNLSWHSRHVTRGQYQHCHW